MRRADPWLRQERERTLDALAQRLSKSVGYPVLRRWLRYSERLHHWVWPEIGPMIEWDGYYVWPCVRLWLYDQRRMIWYVSEQEESRWPYRQVGRPIQKPLASEAGDWGAI